MSVTLELSGAAILAAQSAPRWNIEFMSATVGAAAFMAIPLAFMADKLTQHSVERPVVRSVKRRCLVGALIALAAPLGTFLVFAAAIVSEDVAHWALSHLAS